MVKHLSKTKLLSLLIMFFLFSFCISSMNTEAAWKNEGRNKTWVENGKKAVGWRRIGDKWYFFSNKGILQTNKWIDGVYYVDKSGVRVKLFHTINGQTYFFSKDTYKVLKNTNIKYKSEFYRTDANGCVIKSKWIGSTYYAKNTGAFVKGFAKINGKLYFFNQTTCKKTTSAFINTAKGKYYVSSNGAALRNQRLSKNGNVYGFGNDWKMVKSGFLTINKNTYYFNSSGIMVKGVQTINGKKYYFKDNGVLGKNTTVDIGDCRYKVDGNGVITNTKVLTMGDKMVAYAKKFIGNPYVWGGSDPVKGADCSGFVMAIHQKFGINLYHFADTQMRQGGKVISINNIKPGDLVFYGTKSKDGNANKDYASHVTMYAGNDQIIHAANSKPYPEGGIKLSKFSEYNRWSTMLRIVRYWKE